MPGWFDDIGKGSVDEAAVKLTPIADMVMTRLRGTIYEGLERFNGATWELSIVDNKLVVKMMLPPVSPPSVPNQ
jgi:hypothetical protein